MPGQKLGKSFRWFFGKIEGATTPDIVLPLITCPPIFSDVPPALISSGFVGKKPSRRWFMPSVRGWSVQLCDFRDPIFAQGSAES